MIFVRTFTNMEYFVIFLGVAIVILYLCLKAINGGERP